MLLCDRNGSLNLVGPFSTFCLGDLAARPIGSGVFAKYSTSSLASAVSMLPKKSALGFNERAINSISPSPLFGSAPQRRSRTEKKKKNQQFASWCLGRAEHCAEA